MSAGAPPELQFEYHPFPLEAWLVEPLEMLFEPHGHNRCIRVRSLEPQHNGAVIYALPDRLYILPNAPERSAS